MRVGNIVFGTQNTSSAADAWDRCYSRVRAKICHSDDTKLCTRFMSPMFSVYLIQ